MNVATILVTWNQTELTLDCIAALKSAGVSEQSIWIVDNASVPSAISTIHAHFPQVRSLRLDRNRGFAGGCNAGAAVALTDAVEALFFLNNDALVESNTLEVLTKALVAAPRAAAVSPKVYFHGSQRVIQSVGLRIDPNSGSARMIGSGERDCGQHDQIAERDALFGCAMLIRCEAWRQVGGFWEPFFNYAEEVDWCLRARRQGWNVLYVPEASVWHRTSSSLGAESPLKVYLIARNQFYLRRRNQYGGWRGAFGLAYALYMHTRTWARYLRMGQQKQAHALTLGLWDYMHARSGDSRTPDLLLRER
jgi:hypothetical protein